MFIYIGVYTWANGAKYDGEYKDNKKNGHGLHTWPDGSMYEVLYHILLYYLTTQQYRIYFVLELTLLYQGEYLSIIYFTRANIWRECRLDRATWHGGMGVCTGVRGSRANALALEFSRTPTADGMKDTTSKIVCVCVLVCVLVCVCVV